MDSRLAGGGVAAVLGAVGMLAGPSSGLGGVTLALVLGLLAGNLSGAPKSLEPGMTWTAKKLLQAAVVVLGFKLDLSAVASLGVVGLGALVLTMGVAFAVAVGLGRLLGVRSQLAILVGAGSAVCGSSAIAAVAPVVDDANDEDVGVSVAVVNLLGTVGMFLLPSVVMQLGLGESEAGVVIGGSLQAVGHVVAAGFAVSEPVGVLATGVKLGRVAMLVPLVAVFAARSKEEGSAAVPPYLVGFCVAAALGSFVLDDSITAVLGLGAKWLLAISMAAIGFRIQVFSLLSTAPLALALGSVVFAAQLFALIAWVSW